MAQVSVVRLPSHAFGAVPELRREELLALGVFAGGLVAATGLYLFATGRRDEAYAIGIASGITGAFVGAARMLG